MNGKSSESKSSYIIDGDDGFTGLNSKDTPINLTKGILSKSENFRLERGEAVLRKGCKKIPVFDQEKTIYASCLYTDTNGNDLIAIVVKEGLYTFNPVTIQLSSLIPYANDLEIGDQCTMIYQAQGFGNLYLMHGFNTVVYRWTKDDTELKAPSAATHENYPNSEIALYFGNRHIVKTDKNTFAVSGYLTDSLWSELDMFTVNDGNGDTLVAVTPWQLNEFVIFMKNSIFYANVGIGATVLNDLATEDDSYVKSLAIDIGCIARGSIVQALGGILFLSENGVFMLNPSGATTGKQKSDGSVTAGNTPEGMRLLTGTEPLSMPINDIIQRINFQYAHLAVAAYYENRYYLAVPIDGSDKNNVILVYNFLIKSWESVDTYPIGFDCHDFIICRYGPKRRLFAIDSSTGLLLLEELEYDMFSNLVGTPRLPFTLGNVQESTIDNLAVLPYTIQGQLITRGYGFDSPLTKRISSIIAHINKPSGSTVLVSILTTNPDSETVVASLTEDGSSDSTYRIPVKKQGYFAQVKITSSSYRPSVKMIKLKGLISGENFHTNY